MAAPIKRRFVRVLLTAVANLKTQLHQLLARAGAAGPSATVGRPRHPKGLGDTLVNWVDRLNADTSPLGGDTITAYWRRIPGVVEARRRR